MRWLLLLTVVGCSAAPPAQTPDYPSRPGQEQAIASAWSELGGWPTEPPAVRWLVGDELTCHNGRGFIVEGRCHSGVAGERVIWVAWPTGTERFSQTALAHELVHARNWRRPGTGGDIAHTDSALWGAWRTDHELLNGMPGSQLHGAQQALIGAGF